VRRRSVWTAIVAAAASMSLAALPGCVHPSVVERAYDGDVVEGRYVGPEAYAAYLRGVLAEADGRLDEAKDAFDEALVRQPWSPEVWTRIGRLRCRISPRDGAADDAFAHALSLDPTYAPAWSARAACASARGDTQSARSAADHAVELDPGADGANVLLARSVGGGPKAEQRARLVALTSTARDPVLAWDALAAWARGAGDVPLWAHAMRELVRALPSRRDATARAAEELAGAGEIGEARSVAAAALAASDAPLPADLALAARLAVDDAIARRDADAVRVRATRGRVALDEAAARALLAGDVGLARDLAREVAHADPASRGARLVLAACGDTDPVAAAGDARPGDARPAAAALVAFAVAVARSAGAERARVAMQSVLAGSAEAAVGGDDRLLRPAVELVSRGVLPASVLPPDGAVELAALSFDPAAPARALPPSLDARHEYLALALWHPDAARTFELRHKLAGVAARDPVAGAAAAIAELALGVPIAPDAPRVLLARNPADPLLAATALRLAERVGDRDVAARARQALAAQSEPKPAHVD
jgi:hypothetical protein